MGVNATGDAGDTSPAIFDQPGTEYLILCPRQSSACTLQRRRNICAFGLVSLSAVFIQAVTYCPEQ